jgi:hypothetical protein
VDDELMWFESIVDNLNNTYNLVCHRGAFDTIPADHVDNSIFWFVGLATGLLIEEPVTQTTVLTAKILPSSNTETLAEGDASQLSITPVNRANGPMAPADVKADGVLFIDDNDFTGLSDPIDVTWKHRSITQGFSVKQDDANGTLDSGQTYTVELVRQSDQVVVDSASGLTSTSHQFSSISTGVAYKIEVYSIKNSIESQHWLSPEFTL